MSTSLALYDIVHIIPNDGSNSAALCIHNTMSFAGVASLYAKKYSIWHGNKVCIIL